MLMCTMSVVEDLRLAMKDSRGREVLPEICAKNLTTARIGQMIASPLSLDSFLPYILVILFL